MSQIFVLSHWGQGGKGSGYTIVIASSDKMARIMVRDYLNEKSEGYRQYHNMNCFEVEPLEEKHEMELEGPVAQGRIWGYVTSDDSLTPFEGRWLELECRFDGMRLSRNCSPRWH